MLYDTSGVCTARWRASEKVKLTSVLHRFTHYPRGCSDSRRVFELLHRRPDHRETKHTQTPKQSPIIYELLVVKYAIVAQSAAPRPPQNTHTTATTVAAHPWTPLPTSECAVYSRSPPELGCCRARTGMHDLPIESRGRPSLHCEHCCQSRR